MMLNHISSEKLAVGSQTAGTNIVHMLFYKRKPLLTGVMVSHNKY